MKRNVLIFFIFAVAGQYAMAGLGTCWQPQTAEQGEAREQKCRQYQEKIKQRIEQKTTKFNRRLESACRSIVEANGNTGKLDAAGFKIKRAYVRAQQFQRVVNNPQAALQIGNMHALGFGVTKNLEYAGYYYRRAIQLGAVDEMLSAETMELKRTDTAQYSAKAKESFMRTAQLVLDQAAQASSDGGRAAIAGGSASSSQSDDSRSVETDKDGIAITET